MDKITITEGEIKIIYETENFDNTLKIIEKFLSKKFIKEKKEPQAVEKQIKNKESLKGKIEIKEEKFPPIGQIIEYIKSKPKFEHNIFEVMRNFFGQTINSRGETRDEFIKFSTLVAKARDEIEDEDNWDEEWHYGPGRARYKIYWLEQKSE